MKYLRSTSVAVLVLLVAEAGTQTVKRGRDEGTMNIPASNVMGNGNLDVAVSMGGAYSTTRLMVEPMVGMSIGIAEIMQLSAYGTFPNFNRFGSSDVNLQMTMPGNDHLRFFGLAAAADLFLSTTMDTLSGTAATGRPKYNPYLWPTVIVDLDWLARVKTFPLKTYLSFSLADDPDALFLFQQLSFKSGFEWKMYQHGVFMDAGVGLYKEKRHLPFEGDQHYQQRIAWLEPGGRYRLWGRFSITGSIRFIVFQDLKKKQEHENPLSPDLFQLRLGIETPVIFKETNTEAIRTLVFMEQEKGKKKDVFAKNIEQGKILRTDFEATFENLESGIDTQQEMENERDVSKRREEIQKKMDEIEQLFQDLDEPVEEGE